MGEKNHLYHLGGLRDDEFNKKFRATVVIDIDEIEGKRIDTIDDYLLYFDQCRIPCYIYVSALVEHEPTTTIKLSDLHRILTLEPDSDEHKKLMGSDPAYEKISNYTVNRKHYQKYKLHIDLLLWDAVFLMIPSFNKKARKGQLYLALSYAHKARLLNETINKPDARHHKIQEEVKEVTKEFFDSLIDDLKPSLSGLHITYMHRRLSLIDLKGSIGMVLRVGHDGKPIVEPIRVLRNDKPIKDDGFTLLNLARDFPVIQDLISNFNHACTNDDMKKYIASIAEIKKIYKEEYDELFSILKEIYTEFKDKPKHGSRKKPMFFVSEFNGAVAVRRISDRERFLSSIELYEKNNDGEIVRVCSFDGFPMQRHTIDQKVENLLLDGFLNLYSDANDIGFEYMFEFSEKNENSRNAEIFKWSFLRKNFTELYWIAEDYLKDIEEIKTNYEQIKSNDNFDMYKKFEEYCAEFGRSRQVKNVVYSLW